MKEKKEIVENWLPRYTGTPLDEFGEHVLLTNFGDYVAWFAAHHDVSIKGADRPMPNVTAASHLHPEVEFSSRALRRSGARKATLRHPIALASSFRETRSEDLCRWRRGLCHLRFRD